MSKLYHAGKEITLVENLKMATTFWQRLRGLMLAPPLPPGEALLIYPCNSVHTFFMRYPIDIIFLSENLQALQCLPHLPPYRFSPLIKEATSVLELPAGTIHNCGLETGDYFQIVTS